MPRTGRPVNPLTAVNRVLKRAAVRRAVVLDGLDKFFERQTLRLMKGTLGRGEATNYSSEEVHLAYRTQRLGPALNEGDRRLEVRRSMFSNA